MHTGYVGERRVLGTGYCWIHTGDVGSFLHDVTDR